jgi:organic radical activating enzyme
VINNICTNACSYCPSNLHIGTNHNYDWTDAEKFIKQVLERYPKIHLAISGGEPTLSPWFKDVVKMFNSAGHPVGVTSNGARTANYYRDVSKYLSYITMSYHPSYKDKNFIEKALACAENTRCTVSIMMDSRYMEDCMSMYMALSNYKQLSIQPVKIIDWGVQNTVGRDYDHDQINFINNLTRVRATEINKPAIEGYTGSTAFYDDNTTSKLDAQQLINENNTNFFGWECDIGLRSLYVRFDGIIRSGNCITSPIIGKIQDTDNILWPIQSIICKQNFCICTTDVYISKKKL